MSKCVYVVKGSEDGIIGVYGSFRNARLNAEEYSQGTLDTILKSENDPKGWYWRYEGVFSAEVEKWWIA